MSTTISMLLLTGCFISATRRSKPRLLRTPSVKRFSMQPDYDDDTWSLLEEGKPLLGVAGASQSSRSGRCDQVQRRACPSCCSCIPARYVVAAMLFLAWFNLFSMRVNLSVAIVEMDNSTATLHNHAKVFLLFFGGFFP